VGPDLNAAYYSNYGPTIDIAAPGGDFSDGDDTYGVYSTLWNFATGTPTYDYYQGTSMAAPHVSGLAALLLSEGYSNAQAVARINNTADTVSGIRRINAMRAVGATSHPSGTPTPRATHRSSSTPTPATTHATTKKPGSPAKTVAPPSASPSSSVLAVAPTVAPSASAQAAGPTASTTQSRATQIALAALAIVVVGFAVARVATKRARGS